MSTKLQKSGVSPAFFPNCKFRGINDSITTNGSRNHRYTISYTRTIEISELRKGRKKYDDAKHRITMPPTSQTEPIKTQTPNPQTITSQTANPLTAEGNTKAPSGPSVPSLQDVFPESVSATDSPQKTLAPSDTGQGKGAQLQKENGQKRPKSRPGVWQKLNVSERRLINKQ